MAASRGRRLPTQDHYLALRMLTDAGEAQPERAQVYGELRQGLTRPRPRLSLDETSLLLTAAEAAARLCRERFGNAPGCGGIYFSVRTGDPLGTCGGSPPGRGNRCGACEQTDQ